MRKIWILLVIVSLSLFASSKVQIYAGKIDGNETLVRASGNVVVLYNDYYLRADDAIYNRGNKILQLFGNVRATKGKDYQLLGDYAKLDLSKKEKEFKPFYMLEQKSNLWMSAKRGHMQDNDLNIKTGMISGCDPVNPLWKIEFSSSSYNAKSKWMNLFNARLYLYDIPVFYTPYFGYSLDTTRRSGLLIPSFGASSDEGFFYQQPIYIAVNNWWDMELRPQIRTLRGIGAYETFRFVDSPTSHGEFTTGYFKEQNSYVKIHNLAHNSHYGYHLKYTNSDLLNQWFGTHLTGQSGLYADINWMNDVDFINLSSNDTLSNVTTNQVLSQVNLFYNMQDDYIGSYFKYYLDLSKQSNATTLQNLPTVQYHHYLSTYLKDHLLYSGDVQTTHLYRPLGKNAQQTNVTLPVTLQTSLFDEYLNVAYTSNFYAQHITFGSSADSSTGANPNIYQDGLLYGQYNVFSLNTSLTKAYENVTHTMILGASYISIGSKRDNGFYDSMKDECTLNPSSPDCLFYNVTSVVDSLNLEASQYLYDKNSKQFLYNKTTQQIVYKNGTQQLGDLENELSYNITNNFSFYNDTFYNHTEHLISKSFNTVSYNNPKIGAAVSYLYKDSFIDPSLTSSTPRYTKYLTSSFSYIYNSHYRYFASFNYDIEAGQKKSAEIGFLYSKRCWDFGLRYVENIRPILTTNNLSSNVDDRYIFFTIVLKPIGGAQFNYRIPQAATGP
jgi:LPS-assembly protein